MLNKKQLASFFQTMEPEPTDLQASYIPKNDVRCILFDIYGTLFISATGDIGLLQADTVKKEKLLELIHTVNLETTPEKLVKLLTDEIKNIHAQRKKEGIGYPEIDIVDVWRSVLNRERNLTIPEIEAFAIKFELIVNPVFPMPGLSDCLTWCRKNQKTMGIISNAQFYTPLLFNWFLEVAPQQLGFQDNLIFYSYQHNIAKPSSSLFEKAATILKETGIKASQVVYLGNDMLKDMLPAKQAGFQTALFAGDARSLRLRKDDPKCRGLKPDMIITHLQQLTYW